MFISQKSSPPSSPAPAPFPSTLYGCSCSWLLGWYLQSSFMEVQKCSEVNAI